MTRELFVGRTDELKLLSGLLKKRSASMIVVRGRRRIGKSRLIQEFAIDKPFFAFAGIPPTDGLDAKAQREIFAQQLGRYTGLSNLPTDDWSSLFSLLASHTSQDTAIILFDEISWMGSKDPLFLGKLKNAWDLEFKNNPHLILVLCGSISTWIEHNIISSTAFFGRISLFLKLEELPLPSCRELLRNKGFCSSAHEELKILSITGGIPWYLENIQPGVNAEENLRNLCFRKEGLLFNEFDRIFHDLVHKRSTLYRNIVEALADGPLEFKAICTALSFSKSGILSDYLNDLIESGFVSRDYTWSVQSGKSSKLSHYRLIDNYLRFYLKQILPNRERILRGHFEASSFLLAGWNSILGLQFENLILKNRSKIWEQLGLKACDIIADNPYFQRKTSTKSGCQIDYLIQTRFNTLFACEIKFSSQVIQSNIIEEMQEKLKRLVLPKRFSSWPVLIHINGVSDRVADSGYFSSIIDFSDLLKA